MNNYSDYDPAGGNSLLLETQVICSFPFSMVVYNRSIESTAFLNEY